MFTVMHLTSSVLGMSLVHFAQRKTTEEATEIAVEWAKAYNDTEEKIREELKKHLEYNTEDRYGDIDVMIKIVPHHYWE